MKILILLKIGLALCALGYFGSKLLRHEEEEPEEFCNGQVYVRYNKTKSR